MYLVDLEEAVDLAALVLLLLHFLSEALSFTLFDGVCVFKGPASSSVGLTHVVTRVTASTTEPQHRKSEIPLVCRYFNPSFFN